MLLAFDPRLKETEIYYITNVANCLKRLVLETSFNEYFQENGPLEENELTHKYVSYIFNWYWSFICAIAVFLPYLRTCMLAIRCEIQYNMPMHLFDWNLKRNISMLFVFTGIWHKDALFDGFRIVWGKTTEKCCVINKIIAAFPSQKYCGFKYQSWDSEVHICGIIFHRLTFTCIWNKQQCIWGRFQ